MTAAPALPRTAPASASSSPDETIEVEEIDLVQIWQRIDLPNKAWRAEIIEESIVLTPPPGHTHNLIADLVHEALVRTRPAECGIFQTVGISIPSHGNVFIPDLVVIPRGELRGDAPFPVDAGTALLTVEITSRSNAERDRTTKLHGYASAGVPLYLLIDQFSEDGPSVTLYSDPADGHYREQHRVPFGKPIDLPDPFNVTLETEDF